MKIGLAQINTTVGDFAGNSALILKAYREAVAQGAQMVITPELAMTGYPPRDLVHRSRFVPGNIEALRQLAGGVGSVPIIVGFVDVNEGAGKPFRNAAAVLQSGQIQQVVAKTLLPTYDVFDEDRYFEPEERLAPVVIDGVRVGVTICEDIWTDDYLPRRLYDVEPPIELAKQGVDLLVNLSASPFSLGKPTIREKMLGELAAETGVPVVYCNAVGGNDQLVFDGNSLVIGKDGEVLARLAAFAEEVAVVDVFTGAGAKASEPKVVAEELYQALVLGLRDYVTKCGFKSCVLGLSGGIDSALVAVLAAEALGPANVLGVSLPSVYSSEGSKDDARELAEKLGIQYETIPIQPVFEALKGQTKEVFAGKPEDVTEENMQSRIRGVILMSLSNKFGHLLLTTGNKSEMAVGYCTIYGDMCGGLSVISDLPKTRVYEVSRWINREREIIPWASIEKPPSAELRPDQKDQDTLPEYDVLDGILELFLEQGRSIAEIVARDYDEELVRWILRRVDLNEWKRHQAAPGLKVTSKAFGMGRRIPIVQRFRE
jgi:NAD+ synthase (glutamine-hydrolysing)